jgi:hypothetical protein
LHFLSVDFRLAAGCCRLDDPDYFAVNARENLNANKLHVANFFYPKCRGKMQNAKCNKD